MSTPLQGATGENSAKNSGAFAQGSTASQFTNAAAINFTINGRFYQKAIVASQALVLEANMGANPVAPNSFLTVPAGQACGFAIFLDAAGAFTVGQGLPVEVGSAVTIPASPANKLIVGAIKVVNLTNPFIPGTTNFNATGVTSTFINLSGHPGTTL